MISDEYRYEIINVPGDGNCLFHVLYLFKEVYKI